MLGGWFLLRGGSPGAAPWFQLNLGNEDVPWLFSDSDSGASWVSASAEILSSLVELHILLRDFGELTNGPGLFRSFFSEGKDNKAAEALSLKLLKTKNKVPFTHSHAICEV